jgi:hypothetical protein
LPPVNGLKVSRSPGAVAFFKNSSDRLCCNRIDKKYSEAGNQLSHDYNLNAKNKKGIPIWNAFLRIYSETLFA